MPTRSPHQWPKRASVVLALCLVGCGSSRFGQPRPATQEATHTLTLWRGFFIAACAVGGLVLGLILFAALRFRRRNDEVPSQKQYNVRWEVLYTVTPIVIVAVLFGFSVAAQDEVDHTVAQPAMTVTVVGFQWGWQFHYEDRNVTVTGSAEGATRPTLVLPAGQTTRLKLETTDVIHSFWVPAFLEKRDMIPGVDNAIDVTPTAVGTYDGKCAEFCALDHWRMTFTLQVVPPDQLDAAIAAAAKASSS